MRQRVLDDLIDETETLIAAGASKVPPSLRGSARRILAVVHGRVPPWLEEVTAPESLLDHLFVAEGKLRQDHYSDRRIELDEPAGVGHEGARAS